MAATGGFWCYAREDDELDEGRILRLADRLKAEFSLQTATELELFVDRDLKWGEAWRQRIERELSNVTFLIPVVTPRFFQRTECRDELRKFWTYAKRLGVEEQLLPILYIEVSELREDSPSDELMALIKERQWQDWTDLRLKDEDSEAHRVAINRLAERIAEIASGPSEPPQGGGPRTGGPQPESGGPAGTAEADEEPGWIELLARGEEALPRWQSTIERLTPAMELMTRVAEQASEQMQRPDIQRKGYAGLLRVMRQLAKDLSDPAKEILEIGQAYASELLEVDPAIQTLLHLAEDDPSRYEEADAREFFEAVMQMAEAAGEAVEQLQVLVVTIDEAAKMSKDLRPPLNDIKEGLRNIVDGQSVIEDWRRRASELERRGGNGPD